MRLKHSDIDYIIQIVDDALYEALSLDDYASKSNLIEEEIKNRLRETNEVLNDKARI